MSFFFFFKQKTAYEMRISDWSSDVCSSDLRDLTRIEFDLLVELIRRPNRVWSRESLLRTVWGNEWSTDTHLVEVHVGNLRKKLGDHAGQVLIRTVRGIGYRMEPIG